MEVMKTTKKLCLCCMKEHEVPLVRVPERNTFKGVDVEYMAEYEYCKYADEYIAEDDMISQNDIAMKDAYRAANNLLTSSQIAGIRLKYGMSQTDLASLLGWGGKTITRYESHQVQDIAHDCILKKIDDDPEWFLELLSQGRTKVSELAYRRYRATIAGVYEAMQDSYLRKSILAKYARYAELDECCGGVKLNLDKVVDVIRYFANSPDVNSLYKVKLMKLLWYADSLSYKRRGYAITGLIYRALPMGAVPIGYESIVDLKGISYEEEEFPEGSGYHFIETSDKTYKNLNEEDRGVLDTVILVFGKNTKRQIVNRMHNEKAYKETARDEIISFKYAEELSVD